MCFILLLKSDSCKCSSTAVSKAQHGCIDCLALMICTELQALKSFKGRVSDRNSPIGKNLHPGWYPDIIVAFVFLTRVSCDFYGSKCQGILPGEVRLSLTLWINCLLIPLKLLPHPCCTVITLHPSHQPTSCLFVCAWQMYSSVLARRSQILEKKLLFREFFQISFTWFRCAGIDIF